MFISSVNACSQPLLYPFECKYLFSMLLQVWTLALNLYSILSGTNTHFLCFFKHKCLPLTSTILLQVLMHVSLVHSSINACSWPLLYPFKHGCSFPMSIQVWILALSLYHILSSADAHFSCLFKHECLLLASTISFWVQMLVSYIPSSVNACPWPLLYPFEHGCSFHIFLHVWALALILYDILLELNTHFSLTLLFQMWPLI